MDNKSALFHPIISSIQRIALYETKSKYYLVGSNNTQTRFRVLKIDRMEAKELIIYEDQVEYTAEEIQDLVNRIDLGNRKSPLGSGFSRVISAFGIVGFIKFLEGYYINLITKRCKVALIGQHTVYKIEETSMIYIPHESVRVINPEEPRYLKMFQNIDLASNFYFSYSYDLTHTLQHNLTNPKQFIPNIDIKESQHYITPDNKTSTLNSSIIPESEETTHYGIRTQPHRKFVWNTHLLDQVIKAQLHPDWILFITHGFVGQSNINVFGKSVYVTLIARRSSKYAGTRFLKRGANFQGDVANEVETEQMVHDSGVSSFTHSRITSFVQLRGSIPGHWKQDMGKMVAKPAITIDFNDPFAETSGAHFNELLKRYGAPIVILNLVKQRERKKQEGLLSDELSSAVKYLNQFLPVDYQIIYRTFDMARKNKGNANVMGHLAGIARNAVMRVGIFHNRSKFFAQKSGTVVGQSDAASIISLQTGIIRTNCVDCLDRTNTAQFAIGKCVLGYQLCALGVLDSPNLDFDTDCVRMLESLYEDHGDTLALQYGGSQLVHRIKTYRKTAPWTSQGNDIMQTLSRYYSNTFSDAEKQNAINLFLGLFKPEENSPQIWDYVTDYYFHNKPPNYSMKSLTQWYDKGILNCLPYSYNDLTKACFEIVQVHSRDVEMIDAYSDYYRPYELSVFADVFAIKISNSIRDFMPNFTTNYSPFALRVRPVRGQENSKTANTMKNPSVTGQSSTSSTASSTSSSSDDEYSDEDESGSFTVESQMSGSNLNSKEVSPEPMSFKGLFPGMREVYGTEICEVGREDVLKYKRHVLIGRKCNGTARRTFTPISVVLRTQSKFSEDSSLRVAVPEVSQEALRIYTRYVIKGRVGGFEPGKEDLELYKRYALF